MINGGGRDDDGREVFLIGLSDDDIERLQSGDTMTLSMGGLPPDVKLMIFGGSTDKAMTLKLMQENPDLEVRQIWAGRGGMH